MEGPQENPCRKDRNQQQTQPHLMPGQGNEPRPNWWAGEHSCHCAFPASPKITVTRILVMCI